MSKKTTPIAEAWNEFEAIAFLPNASRRQREDMCVAFFTGARSALQSVKAIFEDSEATRQEKNERFVNLYMEMNNFQAEVIRSHQHGRQEKQ